MGPLHFQAGCCRRWLNLALVFVVFILCCSTLLLICECCAFGMAIIFIFLPCGFFLLFFPRLISVVGDWMSTILPHNKGRKVCCKVSLYKNCQRHSCSAINCLSSGINILAYIFPWYLNAKGPTRIGSTCVAHTSPHSAAAVTSLRQ